MSDSVWPHRWQPTRLPRPWDSPGKNTGVGCHFLLQCMKVKSKSEVAQSCLRPYFFHVRSLLLEIYTVFTFGIVNNAAVSIGAQVPIWVPAFSFFGYMPKNMLDILCCVYFTTVKKLKRKRKAGICEITDGENDWKGSWIVKGLAEQLGFYSKNWNYGELCMRVTWLDLYFRNTRLPLLQGRISRKNIQMLVPGIWDRIELSVSRMKNC